MKVKELIERLRDYDPEANVRLMVQPRWPFEDSIAGVVMRDEFTSVADLKELPPDCKGGDVFILDGGQIRYGLPHAWEV
jgi:hypothetical protein